ncbi:SMC family ATPase [Exiguobacterium sp. s36]|uniref:AAA family ATPase n=1 Tax=Exiguobacterium sp. s36 TaxID=2751227 RepID=UPI001BE9E642|nr:SMC family ATPase [Exiguobacterium sp. s36]
MFINKVILENFRIFRGKHEFDFNNRKVIVIEGPNGHGKSTIFDAINWVMSGKISRYIGSTEYQQFNYLINNDALNNGCEAATVELYLGNNGEIKIKRSIKKNNETKLTINNKSYGIKEGQNQILNLLIDKRILDDSDLLASFELLTFIESTLILSQENLEEFVRGNKPSERYKKLEHALGITRYGNDFKEYLQKLKKKCSEELNSLNNDREIKTRKLELQSNEYNIKNDFSKKNGVLLKSEVIKQIQQCWINNSNVHLNSYEIIKNITTITKKEKELLIQYINILDSEKHKLLEQKFKIESRNLYISDYGSNLKIEDITKEIHTLQRYVHNRKHGLEKSNSRIHNLEKILFINQSLLRNQELQTKKQKELDKQRKEIKNILEVISTTSLEINFSEILKFKEQFTNNNEKLNQFLQKEKILHLKEELKTLNVKKQDTNKKIKVQKDILKEIQQKIIQTESNILKLENKKSSNLDIQIHNIINEVQLHHLNNNGQSCLVCGTNFNNSETLKSSIYDQIENSKLFLNEIELSINSYKVNKNKFVTKQILETQKLDLLEISINRINDSYSTIKKEMNSLNFNNSIQVENLHDIQTMIKILQTFKKENENKYEGYLEIEKKLNLIMELEKQVKNIEEEIVKFVSENRLDKDLISNEKKLEKRISKTKLYITNVTKVISTVENKIIENDQLIKNEIKKIKSLQEIKNEIEEKYQTILPLDSSKIVVFIDESCELIENARYLSNNALNVVTNYLNLDEVSDLEIAIKNINSQISEINNDIIKYENVSLQLNNFSDQHEKIQNDLVNKYLNNLSELVNKYFRQISPHSYLNYVNMITKENELFLMLSNTLHNVNSTSVNKEISQNASLTLSAAQSTVLAMSIFLALNKSQNWSNLKVIGIDDPFQNLDDINAFSFIDVISNLILIESRQIFLSTHDSNFGKLLIRKINLDANECAYFKIQSYTEEAIKIQSNQYRLLSNT